MKAENSERLEREKTFKEIASTVNKTPAPAVHKTKVVSKRVVTKRKADDYWINISIVIVISLCLLVLGWEVLLKVS